MKTYKNISVKNLRKMHGRKCKLNIDGCYLIKDGIISVDNNGGVCICNDTYKSISVDSDEMFGKKYSYWIANSADNDKEVYTGFTIEIEEDENIKYELMTDIIFNETNFIGSIGTKKDWLDCGLKIDSLGEKYFKKIEDTVSINIEVDGEEKEIKISKEEIKKLLTK